MQDELRFPGIFLQHPAIDVHPVPFVKDTGLFLRQVAAHFKVSLRQVQCCAVFVLFLLISHDLSFLVNQ